MQSTEFIVQRADYSQTKLIQNEIKTDLAAGEVLFKIDKFALTANNITYAVVGEQVGYWQFFPSEAGWGKIPVWGFGEVIASNHPDIVLGQRFYGYFPMSSHLLVKAGEVKITGFVDITAHRASLPPVYNFYTNVQNDVIYTQNSEDFQLIFRPLFTTSLLIDDFLAENDFFGAKNILITSASSKTAMALAFLLNLRKKSQKLDYQVIALTSKTNYDFVKQLACYDQIIDYQQVGSIPLEPACIVDFAGNQPLQAEIQNHLGQNLQYNCLVGMVHWEQRTTSQPLSNKGTFFFAPTQLQKRSKELGAGGFQKLLSEAWENFRENTQDWTNIQFSKEQADLQSIYLQLLAGKTSPQIGYVFSI